MNSSIKNKIIFIVALPLFSFLLYALGSIYVNVDRLHSVYAVDNLLKLTKQTHVVVDELQKERGFYVGFIALNDKKSSNLVKKQRKETDASIESLVRFIKSLDMQDFEKFEQNHIKKLSLITQKLQAIREKMTISQIKHDFDVVSLYKPVIEYFSYFDHFLSLINNDITISKYINNYEMLQKTKNQAGIERAILYWSFSLNKLDAVSYNRLKQAVSSQESTIKTLSESLPKELQDDLQKIENNERLNHFRMLAFSKIEKSNLLSHIQSLVGYGGLIHQFKNYLLRGDEKYFQQFEKNYQLFISYITRYEKLPYITKEELQQLSYIKMTFEKYKDELQNIQETKSSMDIKSLDQLVKIDDSQALSAIKNLNEKFMGIDAQSWFTLSSDRINLMNNLSDKISKNIDQKIEKLSDEKLTTIFSLVIGTLLLLSVTVILTWKFLKQVIFSLHNFKSGFKHFFDYLNHKRDDIRELEVSNDELGEMATLVNKNIQKIKSDLEKDDLMISDLIYCVKSVEKGKLDVQITEQASHKSLKKVTKAFNCMLDTMQVNIGKDINTIIDILDEYANFKYSQQIKPADGKIEIAINELGRTIENMLYENMRVSATLNDKASALFSHVDMLQKNTTMQTKLVDNSSSELHTISENLALFSIRSKEMEKYSDEVNISANIGTQLASQTAEAMQMMGDMVNTINDAIKTIDEIVIKTNILSLNASVEAVSAGEAGKGFSVVASEVRNLASSSAQASGEIKKIVLEAKDKAEDGIKRVKNMQDGFNQLLQNITKTKEIINETVDITSEQQKRILTIQKLIIELDMQANKTTTIVEQTQGIAKQTQTMAKEISAKAEIVS